MVKYARGWTILHAAVVTLVGAADQKQRQDSSIISNLSEISPDRDLPSMMRSDFIAFMNEMRAYRTRDTEGAVREETSRRDALQRPQAILRIIAADALACVIGGDAGRATHLDPHRTAGVPQDFDG